MFVTKTVPNNIFTLGQAMIVREDNEDSFLPKMGGVAAVSDGFAFEEGDIYPVMLYGGDVLHGTAFGDVDMNEGIFELIGLQQVGEEAGSQRREDTDPHDADFASSCCTGILQSVFYATHSPAGVGQEFAARIGERYTTVIADEQRNTDLIFQISDTSTDRRFPNAKLDSRLAEASLFRGSQNVAEILQDNF
ncbi:hypothetical protein FBZ89_13626 [Nitrospirillum amazonense]|uniref:Uncharacterized protein n=1 Tax=Nitrospirillum amazonense TaxID=28077 RepID=A0A560EL52_9PROT|nr:hypothetical protein [Nitrospirillum amazonense]TWB10089.1 hypothetical protein FBZ89_13626 [Nitrospirillum amazonense]